MVNRDPLLELTLEEMIIKAYSREIYNYDCAKCKMMFNKIGLCERFLFEENKFLIININNISSTNFLRTKIKNFRPERFSIPLSLSECVFELKAAIIFEPNDDTRCFDGGHNICWQKISSGWVKISDNKGKFSSIFQDDLIGVNIMFFNKIN